MHGRLNCFQKAMLQWNELHPYNAVHVVRIPGVLNGDRLQHVLKVTLEQRGLARLTINREENTYAYPGGAVDIAVKLMVAEGDPRAVLQEEVERQLNTPFEQRGAFNPFRFFAVATGDSFHLGLAYFHAVADGESVVLLLRHLVQGYLNQSAAEPNRAMDLYPDHRARLLSRHPSVVGRKLLGLPAQIQNFKQSHRPHYRDARDQNNGFTFFPLGPQRLSGLLASAKSLGVTVNDLLLALLLKSVSPLSGERSSATKRRKISAGCIVNLRQDLRIDSAGTFGLFLGSFAVTHAVPDGITPGELARDLCRQTRVIKQQRLYLGTPMDLGVALFLNRFFSLERRRKFYQKNHPLWGGLTNMNLNSLWGQAEPDAPLDYFRGVSTGPATPLVFSVTTVGNRANVGLSFRSTVFSPTDIEQVKSEFIRQLEQLQSVA
jgi:hypothetical protein